MICHDRHSGDVVYLNITGGDFSSRPGCESENGLLFKITGLHRKIYKCELTRRLIKTSYIKIVTMKINVQKNGGEKAS